MKKALSRVTTKLYHYKGDIKVDGTNGEMIGNCTGLSGDCSGLSGDCTGLYGNCTGLRATAPAFPATAPAFAATAPAFRHCPAFEATWTNVT